MWPAAVSRWRRVSSSGDECLLDPGPSPDSAKTNLGRLRTAIDADWLNDDSTWSSHHASFIYSWIWFERHGSPKNLAQALSSYCWSVANQGLLKTLTDLTEADCSLTHEQSARSIHDAVRETGIDLIRQGSSKAVAAWRAGDATKGLALCTSILESPLEDEWEERGLDPVIQFAHELSQEVESATANMENWTPNWKDPVASQVGTLTGMERAFGKRHPAAATWRHVLQKHVDAIAAHMRTFAIDAYNERDDEETAERVMAQIDQLTVSPQLRQRIADDRKQLRKNSEGGVPRIPGLTNISSAPSSGSCQGIGAHVYDVGSCPTNHQFNFSVQYFTILFLPIFPLGRYLSQPGLNGKLFFGSLPWTKGMYVHLALSLAVIVIGLIAMANGSSSSSSYESPDRYGYDSSSAYSSPYGSGGQDYDPPSYGSTADQAPPSLTGTIGDSPGAYDPPVEEQQPAEVGADTIDGLSALAANYAISNSELSLLTAAELRLLRNAIYARHGYVFRSADLKSYFASKRWYLPRNEDMGSIYSQMSESEKATVEAIKALEG